MGIAHVRAPLRLLRALLLSLLLGLPVLAMIPAFAPGRAGAHDQSFSKVDVRWDEGRVSLSIELHPDGALALGAVTPAGEIDFARLSSAVATGLRLEAGGVPLPLRLRDTDVRPRENRVVLAFDAGTDRSSASLGFQWALFPAAAQHETYVKVFAKGRLIGQDVLTAEHPRARFERGEPRGALDVVARYLAEGIHHIFIGPDHILFIVGLVLLGGGVRRILTIATSFTAAHSITLALAALGILRPPPGIVEPLIALSIVYAGVDNLRARDGRRDWRGAIAFAFGLMHGFGFASVLHDVGLPREALAWSLLGFNLGVEAGQVCIVLLVAPALGLLAARRPGLAARVVAVASCAIIAAGGVWFVQRVAAAWT